MKRYPWLDNYIRTVVREVLAGGEVANDQSVTASVPHALQEKCVRCGFTKSAHSDQYCPVGRLGERLTFLGSAEVIAHSNALVGDRANGDNP